MLTPVASARVWASSTASTKTEVSGFSGAVVPKPDLGQFSAEKFLPTDENQQVTVSRVTLLTHP